MHKLISINLIAGLAILAGVWLGEGWVGPTSLAAWGVLVLFVIIGARIGIVSRRIWRLLIGLLVGLLVVGGWYLGTQSAGRAFNACVTNGEEVRSALTRYHAQHGEYPESLAELDVTKSLPGKRWLRPNLLIYQTTPAGYQIQFSDWLVTFSATNAQPFMAQK